MLNYLLFTILITPTDSVLPVPVELESITITAQSKAEKDHISGASIVLDRK